MCFFFFFLHVFLGKRVLDVKQNMLKKQIYSTQILFISCLCSVAQSCSLFETPWIVARQAPLSTGVFQARELEWLPISSSRGSYRPRDQTLVPVSPALPADSLPLSHQEAQQIYSYLVSSAGIEQQCAYSRGFCHPSCYIL